MVDDSGDDKQDGLFYPPQDTNTWRVFMMREVDALGKRIDKCVTKEVFEAKVAPIQRVMWLIFSVVTTALVAGVLALLFQSGKIGR